MKEQVRHDMKATPHRSLGFRIALILIGIPIAAYLGLALDIWTYASRNDGSSADVAIVLGAAVWTDRPSPVFEERIKHAIHLYHAGTVKHLVFTGGVGQPGEPAESIIARDYAIARGVPAEDISYETVSSITWENLGEAQKILAAGAPKRVLVVSDPLHMRRAMLVAHDLGINAYPSPTPTTRYTGLRSRIDFLRRETYYYALYLCQRPFNSRTAAEGD
jgi:uncharacterized SAM-binding protein YcdF (DUF218 family)